MEYHGPGFDYSDKNDRRYSVEQFLVDVYPIVMPLIILAIGVCLAIAVGDKP